MNEQLTDLTCKHLAVILEDSEGNVHQVALTIEEAKTVESFIVQLHEGTIKVHDGILQGVLLTNKK